MHWWPWDILRCLQPQSGTDHSGKRWIAASAGHGIALLCVAAALALSLPLQSIFPYPFLFLFFAGVMASAWFGGTAPGLFAVLLSTLAVDYFFVPPFHSFAVNATDTAYFAAFVVCALAASWVSSSKRNSEEALREARDHLEARVAERTAELQKTIAELQENERQREQLVKRKIRAVRPARSPQDRGARQGNPAARNENRRGRSVSHPAEAKPANAEVHERNRGVHPSE